MKSARSRAPEVAAHVLAVTVELHLPTCQSLKEKRAVLSPILSGARRRFEVSAAETAHADTWHSAELGFAVVSGSVHTAGEVIDGLERFIWSFPEIEVVRTERNWLEVER